eukprot:670269-Prorocentrum_minimum.AAC.2
MHPTPQRPCPSSHPVSLPPFAYKELLHQLTPSLRLAFPSMPALSPPSPSARSGMLVAREGRRLGGLPLTSAGSWVWIALANCVASPGVDCRPARWQSVGREYTWNIQWNIRNAVR